MLSKALPKNHADTPMHAPSGRPGQARRSDVMQNSSNKDLMSKVGPKKHQHLHEEEKYQDDAQFPFRQSRRRIVDENDSPTR
jgi:hypothetical protein